MTLKTSSMKRASGAAGAAGCHVFHYGLQACTVENNVDEVLARLQSASGVDDFIENVWPEISNSEMKWKKALYDLFFISNLTSCFRGLRSSGLYPQTRNWGKLFDDRITRPAEAFIKGESAACSILVHSNDERRH